MRKIFVLCFMLVACTNSIKPDQVHQEEAPVVVKEAQVPVVAKEADVVVVPDVTPAPAVVQEAIPAAEAVKPTPEVVVEPTPEVVAPAPEVVTAPVIEPTVPTVECKLQGTGEGSCQFTNAGEVPSAVCGKVYLFNLLKEFDIKTETDLWAAAKAVGDKAQTMTDAQAREHMQAIVVAETDKLSALLLNCRIKVHQFREGLLLWKKKLSPERLK